MYPTAENAQGIRIIECYVDQLVVREDRLVKECEEAVLGCLDSCDVSRETNEGRAERLARFAVYPPVVAIGLAFVLIAFRLHSLDNPLVYRGEVLTHLALRETEEVDHHDASWPGGQIPAVAIEANVFLCPWHRPETKTCCFFRSDNETGAV